MSKEDAKGAEGVPSSGTKHGRELSADWYEASSKKMSLEGLCKLLETHFGPQFGREALTVLRDDEAWFDAIGPFSVRVRADRVGQQDRHGDRLPWVGVRVPGEACRVVGTTAVLDVAEMMRLAGGFKVSRLDLALDDYDKTFSPRRFAEACVGERLDDENALLGPKVVTRVRRDNWEWSRRKGGCFWLGGRKSPRLLRVYDKDQESEGKIPSTRIELQSRDEFATALVGRLLDARWAKRPLAEVWAEHVVEFVDLREPKGDRSASHRWPRLCWWEVLVGDVSGVPIAAADNSTVGQWWSAMQRQCGGFAGVALRAEDVGEDGLERALKDPSEAEKVVKAVRAMFGRRLPELSQEHEVRLKQVLEAREAAKRVAERAGLPLW